MPDRDPPPAPTAAFLVIGNEILSGRTHEGNLPVLAKALGTLGIPLAEARVVRDESPRIVEALDALRAEHDYVFTSGGLGPTHDDITAAAIAEALGVSLVRHPDAFAVLAAHYERKDLPFNTARQRMANVPEGAQLVANPISAAPGFRIENVIAFAGVPEIFRAMLGEVLPTLTPGTVMLSRSLHSGLPEGVVAEALATLQAQHPDVEIGSYPRMGPDGWATTLVLRGQDPERLAEAFSEVQTLVRSLGGTPVEA
jgi:molybdenum cofactor synthesis domain-containing protein